LREGLARLLDWEAPMTVNIGRAERLIRVVLGVGILSLAFVGPQSPWAYLGLVPLLTGLVGWCPPYALLGIGAPGRDHERG
jgi:hypothetical protein